MPSMTKPESAIAAYLSNCSATLSMACSKSRSTSSCFASSAGTSAWRICVAPQSELGIGHRCLPFELLGHSVHGLLEVTLDLILLCIERRNECMAHLRRTPVRARNRPSLPTFRTARPLCPWPARSHARPHPALHRAPERVHGASASHPSPGDRK